MKIILSVDKNWAIGKDGDMLFHLKKDLLHFKEETLESLCIMGRKTYESIGSPLPKRENLVLTRDKTYKEEGIVVVNDLDELLTYVDNSPKEAYVIGGNEIVDLLLPYCDEAIITKIDSMRDADTYLHNFDEDPSWEVYKESEPIDEDNLKFTYVYYRRIK